MEMSYQINGWDRRMRIDDQQIQKNGLKERDSSVDQTP